MSSRIPENFIMAINFGNSSKNAVRIILKRRNIFEQQGAFLKCKTPLGSARGALGFAQKLFVERSRDENTGVRSHPSAPLGVHSAPLGVHSAPLGVHSAPLKNCSSSEAETRTPVYGPTPRLRSGYTRLRSGCTRLRSGCNNPIGAVS